MALPTDLEIEGLEEILEWAVRHNVTNIDKILEEIQANTADGNVGLSSNLLDYKAPEGSRSGNNCILTEIQYNGTHAGDFIRFEY